MNFNPPPNAKERSKALDLALQQIEKQFGKGSIMKLGEDDAAADIEVVSTGSIGLDMALGVGGVPRGRVVEIYGPESSRQDHARAARSSPTPRRRAATRRSSMPSTRSIPTTPRKLGVDIDDLLDRPAGHRRAGARDLPTRSCARAPWTSSSSTRSPHSCRAPRSRARWAIRTSVSRPASCRRRSAS
jgi:hypothetical protein